MLEERIRLAQQQVVELTSRIAGAESRARANTATAAAAFTEALSQQHRDELALFIERTLRPLELRYATLRDAIVPRWFEWAKQH